MLENLTTKETIKDQGDVLGGGTYLLDSGVYDMVVDMAYIDESAKGALGVFLTFKGQNRETLRQTIYITSGKEKGQKHTYVDKDGQEQYLPGFSQVNAMTQLIAGTDLSGIGHEEKTINVYDFTLRKEVPVKKQVMVDLIGKKVTLGVVKQTVDKNVKNDQGKWVASGDTREENEIDKMFRIDDGLTLTEIRAEATEAIFKKAWEDKNNGVSRNKAKGAKNTPAAAAPATATKTENLFPEDD